ncbi:hypothetical protein [Cupriavidus sp. D39]|uniref:hypothetical protein n=1 Tax=Cupriavidus sp. D39 TaxID=2997877 RepID=UPI00226F6187|nr:hypothetical protein [Cupriavidus sp. D39]MCY0854065.1 hypothetical protein [Cupriavidus sp. D39]
MSIEDSGLRGASSPQQEAFGLLAVGALGVRQVVQPSPMDPALTPDGLPGV